MARPFRMNLVDVQMKLLDIPKTPLDQDYKEPGQNKKYSDPIDLEAQVNYTRTDEVEAVRSGDRTTTDGHLCFRTSNISSLNLKKGDLITSIAGETVNYKVSEIRRQGHFRGRPIITFVFFEENKEKLGGLDR